MIITLAVEQEQNELNLMSSWVFEKCSTSNSKYHRDSINKSSSVSFPVSKDFSNLFV